MAARRAVTLEVCGRCAGSGVYTWGGSVNGRPVHSGPCFRCQGGGEFQPTSGAVWYARHGRAILSAIEQHVQALAPPDHFLLDKQRAA